MIEKFLQAGVACCLLPTIVGCNAINQVVGNSVSVGLPENQEAQQAEVYQRYFAPEKIDQCFALPRNSAERQSCRDQITYARLRYIDINYEMFRRRVFLEVSGGNAAADITVLGLGAAGALVGTATTKAILAAISAGIVGAKAAINRDVLYNSGVQTLILKMDADRAALRLRIIDNLKQNELVYPFEAAELDTGDYFRVGTLSNALITLQGDAASTLTLDRIRINTRPPQLENWSPPGPTPLLPPIPPEPVSSAVLPVPPPPTPPAAIVSPLPSQSPPAQGPVKSPGQAVHFKTRTTARSELFRALGSDAQGSRPFDPARVQLMHQCWSELFNPVPDLFSTWVLQASDQSLTTVTRCINGKARGTPSASGTPVPFVPTTAARSDLFRALGSDAQGSRPFDPARVKLMRQCWSELLNPVPDNVAAWLQEATDQSFTTVAQCINGKARGTPSASGTTVPFVPTTAARSELFLALLSDAEGKQAFDPSRVQLMRQCWSELLKPAPDNVATWLQQATDQTLQAVAVCIKTKVASGER